MVVLLSTEGGAKVNGGEWRATAALVTCTASFLRVGLLLLENGAAVGPMPEVSGTTVYCILLYKYRYRQLVFLSPRWGIIDCCCHGNPFGDARQRRYIISTFHNCVCVCVCVFIKLHITTQSGPVILVILCHSH